MKVTKSSGELRSGSSDNDLLGQHSFQDDGESVQQAIPPLSNHEQAHKVQCATNLPPGPLRAVKSVFQVSHVLNGESVQQATQIFQPTLPILPSIKPSSQLGNRTRIQGLSVSNVIRYFFF